MDKRGTLIVGSPRSGTTLALECMTPGLTDDERYLCNEPDGLGEMIVRGRADKAWAWIDRNIDKLPAPIIKSPHLSVVLDFWPTLSDFHIVVTHRATARIATSMLRYADTLKIELSDTPYWHRYYPPAIWPDDLYSRACVTAWSHYESCMPFATQVLRYGLWDEWPQHDGIEFKDQT